MMEFRKVTFLLLVLFFLSVGVVRACEDRFWEVQSIDTMKYSRDLAREKLNDQSFENVIDKQVKDIADVGATHIAIGTPYDEEFVPFIKVWVNAARKYGLKVWFRGNLSGWEGWFNYPLISKEEHTQKVVQFIEDNSELFEDSDMFSSCPECENGVIGDPRSKVSVEDFRTFITNEYEKVKQAFNKIDKDVKSSYFSMNADVAYLAMDEKTTKALDGIVTIDHYIGDPDDYFYDIERLVARSGGKIVIGEFGAPIPDIHGFMNDRDQSEWIHFALSGMVNDSVLGVNYWTNTASSTGIWTESGREKLAVSVLGEFYKPKKIVLKVENELGRKAKNVQASVGTKTFIANEGGEISILIFSGEQEVEIFSEGYETQILESGKLEEAQTIVLTKEKENIFFRIGKFFVKTFRKLRFL